MFSHLKGILIAAHPSHIVLEVGGVGYVVFIPCRVFGLLPQMGESLLIYTSFVVREFSHSLYGFLVPQERELFEILLNISGVGPKLAISLIGHLNQSELKAAVMDGDLKTLSKVPGVGKKTAERLVVELKDKLNHPPFLSPSDTVQPPLTFSEIAKDATLALVNLGYHQNIAQKAVKETLKEHSHPNDLALLITSALKNI